MILYALSDSTLTPANELYSIIWRLISSGVGYIQYRNKSAQHDEILLKKIAKLCAQNSVKFIINDDPLLAKRVGADGVHVGKDDESVLKARQILGKDAIVGASCYNSLQKALLAQAQGANYAAFGSVFASPTKPNATPCPLEIIDEAKKALAIPVCAIGGINAKNVKMVANADYIAVISALYKNNEIEKNVKEILENSKKVG